jgi:(1->4)-alpha-D-glucan 1-alpha-D-glucosylmutase
MNRRIPVATYRLQLHDAFTLADARARVAYLDRLGVDTLYLSPCLQARPGSPHGYDICDHRRVSDELGGDDALAALSRSAAEHGMAMLLDFVPNHMGADAKWNSWWRDVLENGRFSPFARFFDIDWHPIKSELDGKLLLPILGRPYGDALEQGELVLVYEDGRLGLRYFDHELPLDPKSFPRVLAHGVDALGDEDPEAREFLSILAELRNLPEDPDPAAIAERLRERDVARERLARLVAASERIRRHVEAAVRSFQGEPGRPGTFDPLHDLLEMQAYRIAYWKTAFHEINYRRFFDINDLAALRMEDADVFAATHPLVLRLARDGTIGGLRLDHVDGLYDPRGYLARLREEAPGLYVVVEKILTGKESLDERWAAEGTTGYDFLNEVNGLFVDQRAAEAMRRSYERYTGRQAPFPIVAYVGKKLILSTTLAAELTVLGDALNRISERHRKWRDLTLQSLNDALREFVACFPVYRTYVDESGWRDFDRATIEGAIRHARRRNPAMDRSIFDFLREVLLPENDSDGDETARRLAFAMKLQQYTGPVQAKGLEDTAFYRYNVLLSLAEVGGDPQRFGWSPQEFHAANVARRSGWPHTMLATTTHDTKRSEDARLRIDALTEMPAEWSRALTAWSRINGRNRTASNGDFAPDRNDELMFYQALVGTWPPGVERADETLVGRLVGFMEKAAKEAKLHTSWINDDQAYDDALRRFVTETLVGKRSAKFLASFLPLQRRTARLGVVSSLAQVVLKVVSPGVPDFYQGTELWDFSLVDPDNRRPVDFAVRERYLAELEPLLDLAKDAGEIADRLAGLLDAWHDARVKMYVTVAALRLRQRAAAVFLEGEYLPLAVTGAGAEHVVAAARRHGGDLVVSIVPRLVARLTSDEHPWPIGEPCWGDTAVELPLQAAGRELVNELSHERSHPRERDGKPRLAVAEALRVFPVAMVSALS